MDIFIVEHTSRVPENLSGGFESNPYNVFPFIFWGAFEFHDSAVIHIANFANMINVEFTRIDVEYHVLGSKNCEFYVLWNGEGSYIYCIRQERLR